MSATAVDPEVLDPETEDVGRELALRLRNPQTPVTLNELSLLEGKAIDVMHARIQILKTARAAAIQMTSPEDWVLFKSPDERITAYLQDAGCDRVRDITGIEIYDVGAPEKLSALDGSYMYIVRGNAHSKFTLQVLEGIEGGRMSTDDFCKDDVGIVQELKVRKAARANLDGRCVRQLAGLKTVPIEELEAAWVGTHKKSDHCRKGRGFGTKHERSGAEHPDAPKLVPPKCGVCGATAVYRTSARGGFYGCPSWKQHEAQKWSVDLKDWEKDPRSKPAAQTSAPAAEASSAAPAPQQPEPPPLTDADIDFGGTRPRGRR